MTTSLLVWGIAESNSYHAWCLLTALTTKERIARSHPSSPMPTHSSMGTCLIGIILPQRRCGWVRQSRLPLNALAGRLTTPDLSLMFARSGSVERSAELSLVLYSIYALICKRKRTTAAGWHHGRRAEACIWRQGAVGLESLLRMREAGRDQSVQLSAQGHTLATSSRLRHATAAGTSERCLLLARGFILVAAAV